MSFHFTVRDFFCESMIKDTVYVPPLQKDIDEQKNRATDVMNLTKDEMLQQVYEEFDYGLDVCNIGSREEVSHRTFVSVVTEI